MIPLFDKFPGSLSSSRRNIQKQPAAKDIDTAAPTPKTPTPAWLSKIDPSKLSDLKIHNSISGLEHETLYNKYCESTEVECLKKERMGNAGDGGWEMCVDPRFIPKAPCLIYSFGINDQWDFDDACDLKFQCVHRAFDPSMNTVNKRRGKNINFYAEALAGKNAFADDNLWRLNTLSSLIQIFNETNTLMDYLKIDIEFSEWPSLQTAIDQGTLKNVKQLGVEFHRSYRIPATLEKYKRYLKVFRGLREQGFYKWHTHTNVPCSKISSQFSKDSVWNCYEIIYLNARFL